MKKIFFLVMLLIIAATSFSQFLQKRTLANSQTLAVFNGGGKFDSAIIVPSFPDTLSANIGIAVKYYDGNLIRTTVTPPNSLWMRDSFNNRWENIFSPALPLQGVTDIGNITDTLIIADAFNVTRSSTSYAELGIGSFAGHLHGALNLRSPNGSGNISSLYPALGYTANRTHVLPNYSGTVAIHPTISGQAGKVLAVNATEDALEWITSGGLTNFSAVDANGFDFTVTNPTTTPTLTATTNVGNRAVMFSNSGAITGDNSSTGLSFTTNKQLLVNISEQGVTGTKVQVGGGISSFGTASTSYVTSQGHITAVTYLNTLGSTVLWGNVAGSITSNQNDYAPTGYQNATIFRITTDASREITGINSTPPTPLANNYGRVITVMNIGSNPLVLKANSTSSSENNRFSMTSDITLQSREAAIFQMAEVVPGEGGLYRWRLLGTSGTIGSGGSQNLSYDAANHEVDISGGGTSAVIPLATTSTTGLVSATTQNFTGTKVFNDYSQQEAAVQFKENAIGSSAASGYVWLYAKSDGLFYGRDDAGVETKLSNDAGAGVTAANAPLRISGSTVSADTSVAYDPSLATNQRVQKIIDSLTAAGGFPSSVNSRQWYDAFLITTGGNVLSETFYSFTSGAGSGIANLGTSITPPDGWMFGQRMSTGTTSSGICYHYAAATPGSEYGAINLKTSRRYNYGEVVRFSHVSDGTETFVYYGGLIDDVTAFSSVVDGAGFRYNKDDSSGNWIAWTKAGGSLTEKDTGIPVAADTDYELSSSIFNSVGYFYIKDGTNPTALVETITSNIPNGSSQLTTLGNSFKKLAGTSPRYCYIGQMAYGWRNN